MPPRFAYWTILIDGKPTAFRAREQQELLPTLAQLKRKNTDVVIKWFAQGKLWESPEAQRSAGRPAFTGEKRGGDWRPGGAHKDPRDRFKKKNRPERAWSEKDPATQRDRDKLGPPRGDRPWSNKPPSGDKRPWSGKPRGDRPWQNKKPDVAQAGGAHNPEARRSPSGPRASDGGWRNEPAGGPPHSDRPWQTKPTGPRSERKPWSNKPAGAPPRGDRPWSNKPPSGDRRPWSGKPRGDRPWQNKKSDVAQAGGAHNPEAKPAGGPPRSDRPWQTKPTGPRGKPWSNKPPSGGKRPWSAKPGGEPRKRRDDEPPDRG